jgi:hypothetical protein
MELWVQGLLAAEEMDVDALVVRGTEQTQVRDAQAGVTVLAVSGAMTHTQETYLSLVNEWGSFYLLPPSSYELTLQTQDDLEVILYRAGATIEESSVVRWEDEGTSLRGANLSFDTTAASDMEVDDGANGSVDRTVAAAVVPYVPSPVNLVVEEKDDDTVRLTWDQLEGISRYTLYYGTESRWMPLFEGYEYEEDLGNRTSYDVDGLKLGGWAYYFALTAEDWQGNTSVYSAEAVAGASKRWVRVYLPMIKRADAP